MAGGPPSPSPPPAPREVGPLPPADLLQRLTSAGAEVGALRQLAAVHERLWAREDEARSRRASDAEIAAVKREIDALNGERHQLIDRIDAGVPARAERPEPVVYTETLGELCDRILILRLKARHSDAHARDPELPLQERRRCRRHAAGFRDWLAHLEGAVRRLLADLEVTRATLPPRAELKMYNVAILNPVTRGELG